MPVVIGCLALTTVGGAALPPLFIDVVATGTGTGTTPDLFFLLSFAAATELDDADIAEPEEDASAVGLTFAGGADAAGGGALVSVALTSLVVSLTLLT